MAEGLFENVYNPDVLSCLANLSNDEVFTPPEVVNQMLDMLPQELFSDPDTTFLDPACKTGVFLRETAKRLIKGLEPQFPDLQERIDHIFHKQLFGIAMDFSEIKQYIESQLHYAGHENPIFTEDAMKSIFAFSGGNPRLINRACNQSLIYGSLMKQNCLDSKSVDIVLENEVTGVKL